MAKILVILLIAAIIEATGVVILSRGLKQIRGAREISVSEIARVLRDGCTNGQVLLGTALEAVFYGFLLYMLSRSDVSFIWPLTSLGFIVTTLAAKLILDEQVSGTRWAGVTLIAAGVFLISYSESVKPKQDPPARPPALAVPRADALRGGAPANPG
jgi:drug/metabolite transporter (DMT)-like permease